MIQITPQMRVLAAIEPADFRKGIDGLARLCKEALRQDPFCGWLFVFRNRRSTAIKILIYDGQGFWLCQKRLSSGRLVKVVKCTRFGRTGANFSSHASLPSVEGA